MLYTLLCCCTTTKMTPQSCINLYAPITYIEMRKKPAEIECAIVNNMAMTTIQEGPKEDCEDLIQTTP